MTLGKVELRRAGSAKDAQQPVSYRGPFGPLDGTCRTTTTELEGPVLGPVGVAWGHRSSKDKAEVATLRTGIELTALRQRAMVIQPKMGTTRSQRVVHVVAGDRPWQWHFRGLPGFGFNHLERPDGFVVASEMFGGRMGIDDSADELEVAIVVASWASFLVDRARPLQVMAPF